MQRTGQDGRQTSVQTNSPRGLLSANAPANGDVVTPTVSGARLDYTAIRSIMVPAEIVHVGRVGMGRSGHTEQRDRCQYCCCASDFHLTYPVFSSQDFCLAFTKLVASSRWGGSIRPGEKID
jgi:hypothetical protein